MKTILPDRSSLIEGMLQDITKEILVAAKDKIAMIILFGSYARGDWVYDEYTERHITYLYQSDLDIMIIVKGKYGERSQLLKIENNIEKRLEKKGLLGLQLKEIPVTIVLEPISIVNKCLEEGQYFFSDIKKEGVLLYDSGEFQLADLRKLSWEETKEIAQKNYNKWFPRGTGFLRNAKYAFTDEDLALAAFLLHQATESFYNAILLVFSGYKKKLHDIKRLRSMTGNYSEELWSIFPHSEQDQRKSFELLKKAYIEARYNDDYKITKEQLFYLIKEVEKLQNLTERICLEYINRYDQGN